MDLSFKLEIFEGPLDLLLHLIDKNKVDIYDIPIVELTDQYFAYIEEVRRQDPEGGHIYTMEVMSEFLVMAATLLDIKSRMLLPPEKDEEGEEIDPRSELVEKLLEYKMYKYMSFELRDMEQDASHTLYHAQDLPREVKKWRQPVNLDNLLADVTLQKLGKVFAEVMRRQEDRKDPIRSQFGTIEQEEVDLTKTMKTVQKRIRSTKTCTFRSLLAESEKKGKLYVVVTFLTVLELMKMGQVGVEQEDTFGEIYITAKDRSEWNADALTDEQLAAELG